MALIDEEIVRMKFENGDFNSNIEESERSIKSLDKNLDDLSENKGLDSLSDKTETVSIKFDALRVAVETAVFRIVNSVMDGVSKITHKLNEVTIDPIANGFSKYEEKVQAVQTIMTSTGMTIDEVEGKLDKLSWFADETSYSFSNMISTLAKFTGKGVSFDDAMTSMIGIANWAGTAGVNAQIATHAFNNLAQASGAIKIVDWQSIEAINMDTAQFMNTVIDTAKEWISLGETYSEFIETYGQNSTQFAELVKKNGNTIEEAVKYANYYNLGISPKNVGWEGITPDTFRQSLTSGWFTIGKDSIFEEVMKKYGNFTEEVYKFQNDNNIDTASEAIRTYNEQFSDLIDIVYEAYEKFGIHSEEFRNALKEQNISLQTAMDFVSVKKAQLFNDNLKELAETFKNVSDEFGFESEEFAKAANEAGYSVNDAADMVTNGIERFQQKEKSLGQIGLEAGQEAKTFSDAWGAAIEGVTSQWAIFWQLIFGNYEEARDMWTEFSEVLWETFAGPISKINETLQSVINAGGRLNIIEGIKNIWSALQSVVTPIKEALGEVFEFFAPDENGKYKNAAEYIYAITEAFRRWSVTLNETKGRFYEIKNIATGVFSALKLVAEVIGTVISNLGRIINAVLPNFSKIFTYISQLFSNIGGFEEIADNVNTAITDFTNKIIFKILQIKVVLLVVLMAIIEKIRETFDKVKVMFLIFMGDFDKALETNEELVNKLSESGVVKRLTNLREAFDKIRTAFAKFAENIQNKVFPVIDKIKEKIPEVISKIIDTIVGIGSVGWFIFDMISSIVTSFAELFSVLILGPAEAAEGLTPLETMVTLLKALGPVIEAIIGMIKNLIIGIGEFVKNINVWKAGGLLIIESIITGKVSIEKVFQDLLYTFSNFLKGLGIPVDNLKNVIGGIKKAIEGMFEAFAETSWLEATANMVRSFALSLLILAGSALILSTLDYAKLASSFAVITAFLWQMYSAVTALVGLMKNMEQSKTVSYIPFLNIPLTPLANITIAIIGFATAIFILSAAVLNLGKTFGKYGPEAFGGAISSLAVGMYGMVGAITALITAIQPIASTTTGTKLAVEFLGIANLLGSFAIAFLLMSAAVKVLASTDAAGLAKGIGGVATLLVIIIDFTKLIKLESTTVAELVGIAGSMILFAMAINMLIIPIELMGHMKLTDLAKGVVAIALLLGEFVGTVALLKKINLEKGTAQLIGIAGAMIMFALAIDMLTIPVVTLSKLSLAKMLQGLAGILIVLLGFELFIKEMDALQISTSAAKMIGLAFSFLLISGAINLMTIAVKSLAEIEFISMLESLVGIGVELALIGAFVFVINKLVGGVPAKIISLSIGILAISVAIGILTQSVLAISKLNPMEQANGLIGLLGIFAEIALFLLALKGIDPSGVKFITVSVGLIALSVGIILMTKALTSLSEISFPDLLIDLVKLAVILAGIAAVSALLSAFSPEMITFGISVGVVGAGLYLLGIGIDAMHTAIENIANDPNVQAFGEVVIGGIQTALEGLKPLMDTVKQAWSDMWDEMTKGWRNFWAFINGDTDQLGNPDEYYGGLNKAVPVPTETKGNFDDIVREEYYKTGRGGAEGFQEGADSVDLSILPDEIKPENKGNFDAYVHDEMYKTGQNGGLGLKEGYESVDLTPLPVSTSDTLLTGLKTELDEHSPSKKTYDIGENVTLGLAYGIKDSGAQKELQDSLKTNSLAVEKHSKEINSIIDESMDEVSKSVDEASGDIDIKTTLVDSLLGGIDNSKLLNDDQKKWIKEKVQGIVDGLDLNGVLGDTFNFDDIKKQLAGVINFDDIQIPEVENPFDNIDFSNFTDGAKVPEIDLSGLTGDTDLLSNSVSGLNLNLDNLNNNLANTDELSKNINLGDIFNTSDLSTKAEAEGAAIGDGIKTGITDSTRKLTYNDIIHRNAIMRAAQKDGIWSESFDKALKAAGYTDDFYSTADRLKIYNEARAIRTANFSDRINIKDSAELYRLVTTLTDHGVMSDEFENALRSYYGDDYKELTAKEKNDLVASITDAYAKEEEFIANNYDTILKAYESGQGSAAFKEMFNLSGSSDRDINDFIDRTKAYKNYQDKLQNESEKQTKNLWAMSGTISAFNQVIDSDAVRVTMAKAQVGVLENALKVIESSTQKDGVKKNSLEYIQALDTLQWSYEDAEEYLKAREEAAKTGKTTNADIGDKQQKTTTSSTSETKANTTSTYNPVTTVKADNVTVDTKTTTATAQTSTQVAGDITGYIKEGVQKLTNIDATITLMNTKIDQMAETIVIMNETALNELALLNGWKGEAGAHNAAVEVRLAGIQNKGVPIANRMTFMNEVANSVDNILGDKAARRVRGN